MRDETKAEEADGEPANVAFSGSPLPPHPSSLHTIRLGPPWQITATDGAARHARKFGWPRTLDANERLWLVCEHVPAAAEVYVNATLLGAPAAAGPFAADVTSLLTLRNEVVFSVASEQPLGAVALEVRPN